jgi:DNA-binding XRE family transcriptional regulator
LQDFDLIYLFNTSTQKEAASILDIAVEAYNNIEKVEEQYEEVK